MDNEALFSKRFKVLNFLSTIFILLGHFATNWQVGNFHFLIIFAMSFFFFASGFLITWKHTCGQTFILMLKRRARSLLLPALLWNIIGFCIDCIYKGFTGGVIDVNIYNVLIDGNHVLWYMYRIYIYIGLLGCLVFFIKYKRSLWIIIIIASAIIGIIFNTNMWLFYLPLFLIGAYVGMFENNSWIEHFGNNSIKKYKKYIFLLGFVAALSLHNYIVTFHSQYQQIVYYCLGYFSILLIVLFGEFLSVNALKVSERIALSFFPPTLLIYCMHMILRPWASTILHKCIIEENIFYSVAGYVLQLIIVLLAIKISDKILRKVPKIRDILLGGRC